LSKVDIVNILCTSPARLNKAFDEIRKSDNPMKIYEDFDNFDVAQHNSPRYYSLSGLYRLSQHLGKTLTIEDRRSWCSAIELVGKKAFSLIIDEQAAFQKKVDSAMNLARTRDGNTCQVTGGKRDKYHDINITVHHIYSKEHYPNLAACTDNLISLTQKVHNEFHAWNGGSQKPCTVDHLIQFLSELHPDNYEIIMRLNNVKKIVGVQAVKKKIT
jgi:hypothetical protein